MSDSFAKQKNNRNTDRDLETHAVKLYEGGDEVTKQPEQEVLTSCEEYK